MMSALVFKETKNHHKINGIENGVNIRPLQKKAE